jgi:hypothetical protein
VSCGTDKRRKQLEYKLRNTGNNSAAALQPEQFHVNEWPGHVRHNTIHNRPNWRWNLGYRGNRDV